MGKREIGERALRLRGWEVQGETPAEPVVVFIAAPHTSNHDMFLMLWLMWSRGIEPRFLLKREVFRGPVGPVLRRLGAIEVDRAAPQGLVEGLISEARAADRMALVIAPEGTRKNARHWKSGFYRIAQELGAPICLGWCDGPTKQVGFGPLLRPSGDVRADMDQIRSFYGGEGKRGIKPGKPATPRLREEDEAVAG